MQRSIRCLIYLAALNWYSVATAQTTLTAQPGTPSLDGVVNDGEWASESLVTANNVILNAVADGNFLYLAAQWEDTTENVNKRRWQYDGASWARGPEDEDRIAFIWDMGQNGDDRASCVSMCHGDAMHTNVGFVDVWHWKSSRGNGVGFVDDKYWDTEDRQSDPGSSTYIDNNSDAGGPLYMAVGDPGTNVDFLAADAAALAAWDPFGTMASHTVAEAVSYDSTAAFVAGNTIPWYLLRPGEGDRGSVQAAGKWEEGWWTVEFKRPYAGGPVGKIQSEFDFDIIPGTTVEFTHEIFDNTGDEHALDGFDQTVYTLDLTEIPANTTLVAAAGEASLDGEVELGEYASSPLVTANDVSLWATADGNFLYLAAQWADTTENVNKRRWQYDGSSWARGPEDEDRIAFIWDMDQNGDDKASCVSMCHGDAMHTNVGFVDVWHWKSSRGNGVGFVDDKYWDTEDRQSDPGSSTYIDNNSDAGGPLYMAVGDPGTNVDFLAADAAALAAWDPFGTMASHTVAEAVSYDSTAAFVAGNTIPWYLLRPGEGDRGSVQAAGKWEEGWWTVEFKRPYAGGPVGKIQSEFDFDIIPGTTVEFTHEIFDNTGDEHALDGFDQTVYTLDLSNIPTGTPSSTTLLATRGTPTMDGQIGPGEYFGPPMVTANDVTLYAMGDGESLYMAAHWADTTENVNKRRWQYDGANWARGPEDEDRIAFIWDMGQNGDDKASCVSMCHGDAMHTNVGFVDVWHWKSSRGNGVGFVDDKYWDTEDRQSDPGSSTYIDNNSDAGGPLYMAVGDPGTNVDFLAADAAALAAWDPFGTMASHTVAEAVSYDSTAAFVAGNTIPWYLLRPGEGDRGSVQAAGKWEEGWWTVEFKRPYAGGPVGKIQSEFDFDIIPGTTVEFTHEIFDNTGDEHALDGFDETVYTLDLSGLVVTALEPVGREIPALYTLKQNYPNPFNPSTTIEFQTARAGRVLLAVYDVLGKRLATLADDHLSAGAYRMEFDAEGIPSGVYFYRLEAPGFFRTRTMTLLK